MPIDFFNNQYKVTTRSTKFGICDDIPEFGTPKTPEYIDETDPNKWTAEVTNQNKKLAAFYPIDNCIEILRHDGSMDNRCDGMLSYENNILFIELKDRMSTRGWVQEGLNQLKVTIFNFKNNHDIAQYKSISAQLCNKQRPQAVVSCKSAITKFKDETGFTVTVNRNIFI